MTRQCFAVTIHQNPDRQVQRRSQRQGPLDGDDAATHRLHERRCESLKFRDASDYISPRHLYRRGLELPSVGGTPTTGVTKDAVTLVGFYVLAFDFITQKPAWTALHDNQQLHMDFEVTVLSQNA